ncbi:MAG: peptide deformylase [Rhodospirillales bacterium]|nr:peptide deformylase [Rhodospirillales bacterium]
MAILKIARMGHPVLSSPALPVDDPASAAIARLIGDMVDTLVDANGAGLAAPQVHVPLRLVLFRVPPGRESSPEETGENGCDPAPASALESPTVLINPEIEPIGTHMVENMEACLSLPGLAGMVQRHDRIRYRWTDTEGRSHECEARGFHARVVQHECDHLDGILYPMRMTDLSTLAFTSELGRSQPVED